MPGPSRVVLTQADSRLAAIIDALTSTVVLPSYFGKGLYELQLPVDADALWQRQRPSRPHRHLRRG